MLGHHHRPETRHLAGNRIVVRELDRLAVYGRAGGLQIYELLGMAARRTVQPTGSRLTRRSGFVACTGFHRCDYEFQESLESAKGDAASSAMIERCKQQLEIPPARTGTARPSRGQIEAKAVSRLAKAQVAADRHHS